MKSTNKFVLGAGILISLLLGMTCHSLFHGRVPPRPQVEHRGWVADAVEPMQGWASAQPPFAITDAQGNPVEQDNAGLNVRLFELKRMANGGSDLVNGPQLTGDCTSWATSHAIETTLAGRLVAQNDVGFNRVFPAFVYAVGRVEIWRQTIVGRMPSEGCSVAAICKGAQQRGFVSWAEAQSLGFEYSGQLADSWGRSGPPQKLYELAATHKVLTFSPMADADQVRDAVCNGYGVAFGSDFTWQKYRTIDDRIVAVNCTAATNLQERCNHAMSIDAYDGSTPNGPFFHVQNSWYPNSHPAPIDNSPPCGFWIDRPSMSYIVGKKDCFAISGAEGFASRDAQLFPSLARPPRLNGERKTEMAP